MSLAPLFALLAASQLPTFEQDYKTVLGTAGLTTENARFNQSIVDLFVKPDGTTPLFRAMFTDPWTSHAKADAIRDDLGQNFMKPSEILRAGIRTLGITTRRSLNGNPIQPSEDRAKKPGALAEILKDLKASGIIKNEIPSLVTIPSEVQQAAALVLDVAVKSVTLRRLAVRDAGDIEDTYNFIATGNAGANAESLDRYIKLPSKINQSYLAAAAQDLFLASQTASEMIAKVSPTISYKVEIETQWGLIRICGGSDDTHPEKPILLLIDTGGNDTYLNAPRNASASNWLSVLIDTNGDDKYLSDPALANTEIGAFPARGAAGSQTGPGGALFGIVFLSDRKGNDLYRSHRPSLGSGRFGYAFVHDEDGDDKYEGYRECQGFGHQGAGFLVDQKGNDRYHAWISSQGSAQNGGFGYLLDHDGNDQYIAEDTIIDFPSAQDPKHNYSMCQGAATGRRADYTDGHSLPGGVAILHDMRGDDIYKSGGFGQGVGYWQGVGMLFDNDGNDKYEAYWYAQGAAAHFAIGYLEDSNGDDTYNAPGNMAQGAGHDFSLGVLLDRKGNDKYVAPNLGLGAGNANGIGIFVDIEGNDSYTTLGTSLGKANPAGKNELRTRAICLGVFMDLQGTDTYPEAFTYAGNARRFTNWAEKNDNPWESQLGVFFDR